MGDSKKSYHDDLVEYVKQVRANKHYSHQRLDIIIVVISTSGIFLIANVLLTPNFQNLGLKISLTLFAFSIAFNVIGQIISSESHAMIEEIYSKKIEEFKMNESINEQAFERKEKTTRTLGLFVQVFNYASFVCVITGIILAAFSFVTIF
jgi:hypothetical protein